MLRKTLKANNIELTDAIASYTDKIVLALEKYIDPTDTSALVDIEVAKTTNRHKSGDIFKAEATLHTKCGVIRSESEKDDLYSAIDIVKDEISESLRTKKSKRVHFLRKGGLKIKNLLRKVYSKNEENNIE